jgi:hypothetical protein
MAGGANYVLQHQSRTFRPTKSWRSSMKTIFLAAVAALLLGAGSVSAATTSYPGHWTQYGDQWTANGSK